jgi:tetratricopeptide (TPR) repeat protein
MAQEAAELATNGDFDGALALWRRLLEDPAQRHHTVLRRIAVLLHGLGRVDIALALFREVTSGLVKAKDYRLATMAWFVFADVEPLLVEAYLGYIRDDDPNRELLVMDRAFLQEGWEKLIAAGRDEDAEKLKSAARFSADDVVNERVEDALSRASRAQQQREYEEAEKWCRKALALDPGSCEAWSRLRDVCADVGRLGESRDASLSLVTLLEKRGEVEEARREAVRAAACDPSSAVVWHGYGRRCEGQDRYVEAMSGYRQAIAREPAWTGAWHDLGRVAYWAGDEATVNEVSDHLQHERERQWSFRNEFVDPDMCAPVGRILSFPKNKSIGEVWGRSGKTGGRWRRLGRAQGDVGVPPGAVARLVVTGETDRIPDLSALARLEPDDLEELSLESVAIDKDTLAPLASLTDLRWLSFEGADIAASGALDSPEMLTGLHLSVINEVFGESGPPSLTFRHIAKLVMLRHLNLSIGSVDGQVLEYLREFRCLDNLRLKHALIVDDDLPRFAPLGTVCALDLGHTNVTSAGLAALNALPLLSTLSLPKTDLYNPGLDSLARLRRLRRLDVRGGGADLEILARLRSVEVLQLSGKEVSREGLEILARMPRLKVLSLPGSELTVEDVDRFRAHIGRDVTVWVDRDLDVLTGHVDSWHLRKDKASGLLGLARPYPPPTF